MNSSQIRLQHFNSAGTERSLHSLQNFVRTDFVRTDFVRTEQLEESKGAYFS